MKAPHASEQQIHTAIAVYLSRALPEGSLHFAIDSAGKASIGVAQRLKARGGKRGVPDHLILVPAWPALFLEVKTMIGRVLPEQEQIGNQIWNCGHNWSVVRSVEDAEGVLRELGIPLRATVAVIRERIAAQNEGLKPIRRRASKPRAARPTLAQVRRSEAARLLP